MLRLACLRLPNTPVGSLPKRNVVFPRFKSSWASRPTIRSNNYLNKYLPGAIGGGIAIGTSALVLARERSPILFEQIPQHLEQRTPVATCQQRLNWKDVWDLVKDELLLLFGTSLSALAAALINIFIPKVTGDLINVVTEQLTNNAKNVNMDDFMEKVSEPAKKLIGLFLAQGISTAISISCVSALGARIATKLRSKLFRSMIYQDVSFSDSHQVGEISNRLSADVQDFKHSFKQVVSQGLKNGIQLTGGFGSLYYISPTLTLGMLISMPAVYAVGHGYGALLRKFSRSARECDSTASSVANECISNSRTIKAFATEEEECARFDAHLKEAEEKYSTLGVHIGLFQGASNFVLSSLFLGTLYYGGVMVASNELTSGGLMSFLYSTQTLQKALANLTVLFGQLVKASSAGGRVFEYIHLKPLPTTGTLPLDAIKGKIEFKDVEFTYPTRPNQKILDRFNLEVEEGTVVALCGHSGVGKSTIAALIEQFYLPTKGNILLDGIPLSEYDVRALRRSIGYINQEPALFSCSILENIRYGCPEASTEDIIEAAKQANAHTFISQFPDGYDTQVGEKGVTLSGGQRQRVAIARAILKNPKILLCDEATSALDTESEAVVQEALERVMKGRTVVIIAHRLSTIKCADKIILLGKGGETLECGTHEQLLKKGGMYYKMHIWTDDTK